MSPSLAMVALCDFGTVLHPSEPQFSPLQNERAVRTSWITMRIRWGYRLGRCSRHAALSRVSWYH